MNDGRGNINNIIDTTVIVSPRKLPKLEPIVDKEGYTDYLPNVSDLNTDAPVVPHHYHYAFNINNYSHQLYLGNKEYIPTSDFVYNSSNNSNSVIEVPPHINL